MIKISNENLKHSTLSKNLIDIGVTTFDQAVDWIWKLPYGRLSERSNYSLVVSKAERNLFNEACVSCGISKRTVDTIRSLSWYIFHGY